MLPVDGIRSMMFENDLQLFYVEFNVSGASIWDIKFYIPRISENQQLVSTASASINNVLLQGVSITVLTWQRHFDPQLEVLFKEKYAPKAVVRRINP